MDFLPEEILQYSEKHTTPEPEYLSKVNRDTHANVLKPRMLSGHLWSMSFTVNSGKQVPQKER